MSVCLFTFEVPFKGFFAPTSRRPMSKHFRFSESLGKSNGKKWYQIWKLLLIKGVKSPRRKKFFLRIFHLFTLFKRLFAATSRSPMSKLFRYSESLGKSNGKKWFKIWKILIKNGRKLPRQNKFFTDFFLLHLFTPFKRLFAPNSQSPMSKLFRYSESLGKINGNKWSQI